MVMFECISLFLIISYNMSQHPHQDGSRELVEKWRQKLKERNIDLIITGPSHCSGKPKGGL